MPLPERINAIKTVTYDVPSLIIDLTDMGVPSEDITLEYILGYIEDWVDEDLGGSYGAIYQDENGNEL